MPNDVSCPDPDPNEPVTRQILTEEFAKFRVEMDAVFAAMDAKIEQRFEKQAERLSLEFAQHARAIRDEGRDELRGALEPHDETPAKIQDHESRLERIEARPAKRVRKPAPKPK